MTRPHPVVDIAAEIPDRVRRYKDNANVTDFHHRVEHVLLAAVHDRHSRFDIAGCLGLLDQFFGRQLNRLVAVDIFHLRLDRRKYLRCDIFDSQRHRGFVSQRRNFIF